MSETTHPLLCGKCGASLSGYAPDGLCAACLLESAFEAGAATSTEPSKPSTLLAFQDYEVQEEIARGGMGVVYRARQISLNRPVAIKMILGGHLANAADLRRFRAEAETAAQLQHPNIVAIHEVGEHAGQPFFSMDLIEGRNLAQLVRDEPLPSRKAASYLKTIAEAVQYAHSRGVLHRDLKPSNILIDEHDQPRVTDFGLAKRLTDFQPSTLNPQPSFDPQLTQTGQVLGSPSFIPPEQAAGHKGAIGPTSDVYSLGAILYHLLTGRPPFVAETMTQTLRMVAESEPVSPRLLNASVPRDLETICLKCLEKDPARRYPTAQALADDLNRFLQNEPIQARPVGLALKVHRWCLRNKPLAVASTAILALLLVVAIGSPIVAFRINRERRNAEDARKKELSLRVQAVAAEEDARKKQAEAEAARERLQSSEREKRNNLYVAEMHLARSAWEEGQSAKAMELLRHHLPEPGQEDLRSFEWRFLWQLCQGDALDTLAGHGDFVQCLALSPDGRLLATGSGDGAIKLWDAVTRREIVTVLSSTSNIRTLAFSSDGRTLAAGDKLDLLKLWDVVTHREIGILGPVPRENKVVRFFPDGRVLACATIDGAVTLWDVEKKTLVGKLQGSEKSRPAIAITPDGATIAAASGHSDILLWEVATRRQIATLSGHTANVVFVQFSPNGATLASSSADSTIRLWHVVSRRELALLRGHKVSPPMVGDWCQRLWMA